MDQLTKEQILAELKSIDDLVSYELRAGKTPMTFDHSQAHGTTMCADIDNGGENVHYDWKLTPAAVRKGLRRFGLSEGYSSKVPDELLVPHLNYWASAGNRRIFAFVDQASSTCEAFTSDVHIDHLMAENIQIIDPILSAEWGELTYMVWECDVIEGVRVLVLSTKVAEINGHEWIHGALLKDSRLGNVKLSIVPILFCVDSNSVIISADEDSIHSRSTGDDYAVEHEVWLSHAATDVIVGAENLQKLMQKATEEEVDEHMRVFLSGVLSEYPIPQKFLDALEPKYASCSTLYDLAYLYSQMVNDSEVDTVARMERFAMIAGRLVSHRTICPHCHQEEL